MKLNEATKDQFEAITSKATNVLAIAGPGAGKTATLVARIKRIILDGTPPTKIASLTFTNAAAREVQSRLAGEDWSEKALAPGETFEPAIGFTGTLHAFALRCLKQHGAAFGYGQRIAIIPEESATDLLLNRAKSLSCKTPIAELLALKSAGKPAASKELKLPEVVVATYYHDMREAGLVDYDVLLHEFRAALTGTDALSLGFRFGIAEEFEFLFVDEVQDSAPIDWEIYRELPMRSKFYVGDPDQAVYSFRGGRVREMIAHASDPATQAIRLEDNFRSRWQICEAAQRLIERNVGRIPKRTISRALGDGTIELLDPAMNAGEEIARIASRIKQIVRKDNPSIAILARTNAIADEFRKMLPEVGIPVVELKREKLPADWSFARSLLEFLFDPENDALAYFHVIARNERTGMQPGEARKRANEIKRNAALRECSINEASLRMGRVTTAETALQAIDGQASLESCRLAADTLAALPRGSSLLDFALALSEIREVVTEGEEGGVRVLTMHSAKGREFDVVFVVGFEDEAIPGRNATSPEGLEEERRLAYVAITRARRALFLSHAEYRTTAWRQVVKRTPSRFISEIIG